MFRFRGLLYWCVALAFSALILGGCSDAIEEEESINPEQLEAARLKILSGHAGEAIELLSELNQKFPDNTEVMNFLGEAHREKGDYLQAAFWYEQVAGLHPNGSRFLKLAGECYEFAGDDESAALSYSSFVSRVPEDGHAWRKLSQLWTRAAQEPGVKAAERKKLLTDALDAFNKVRIAVTAKELLDMAKIYREKNILPKAEALFRDAFDNPNGDKQNALLGLLDVYLAQRDREETDSTIRLLNKKHPGAMDSSHLAPAVIQFLMKRHPKELGSLSDEEDLSVKELLAELDKIVVVKVKRPGKTTRGDEDEVPEIETPEIPEKKDKKLADFFDFNSSSVPPKTPTPDSSGISVAETSTEPTNTKKALDFLQRAKFATAEKNFEAAQLYLREAIKEDPSNPALWYQRSKVHHIAGELREAKMTATETVRLAPDNLDVRYHYLRMVRLIMPPERLLQALEKAKEKFPESHEIVWQLALHYHHVESNDNAATILYRSFLKLAPKDDPRRERAKRGIEAISQP